MCKQGGICRGNPGNFPFTESGGMERGGEGKGKGKGGRDHLPYFPHALASASNTTLRVNLAVPVLPQIG